MTTGFRLSLDQVQVSRTGAGDRAFTPVQARGGQALLELLGGFDADVLAALEQQQANKLPIQERTLLVLTCSTPTASST